jgi:tRNA(Arg) A34 adenosine deaminase TadA
VNPALGFSCTLPSWVTDVADFERAYETDSDKMDLAIDLGMNNVTQNTGGPFGAAIFDAVSHRLIAPGVNLVVAESNPTAHAEIVAMGVAGNRLGRFDLGDAGASPAVLVSSVEPCAMCLGAIPWSGVSSVLVGARDVDARAIGFDEGAKPEDWVGALRSRGISVRLDVQREGAKAVLDTYAKLGGQIYNPDGQANDA